jgi:4-amino-4-deoxy-L-arabinose transferase-like glycosyltransferase
VSLKPALLLLIPLSLSAFTHIWNPVGFPDIFFDEGVYVGRALHVLAGLGPQERAYYYDHPYFGQIFLAAVFKLIGYPGNMFSSTVNDSIESLYAIPRILMGVLAVIDTFLIYKMTERRYNTSIAFLASILFAVMPISWFTRRIMLDSILLPFLLSSILIAVWLRKNQNIENAVEENGHAKKYNKIPLVILSGIFLGLAIFTKIPAVVMIPLVGYLIFSNSNKKWRTLGLWLVPVILIPLIWPAYSIEKGDFQYWIDTAIYQATRSGAPLFDTLTYNFTIDPVLYILFFGSLILAALRKNLFVLLWAIPFLIFLYFINWAPYTSLIPLIPVFCISSAILLHDIVTFVIRGRYQRWALWSMISAIGIFGLISTTVLITLNVTSAQFQTMSFVAKFFQNDKKAAETYQLVSSPIYSWIFNNIYKINFVLLDYYDYEEQSIKPDKTLLIADGQFHDDLGDKILSQLYNETQTIKTFKHNESLDNLDTEKYPYTSLNENNEGLSDIEVRLRNNDKHISEPQ